MLVGCPILDKFELMYGYEAPPRPLMPLSALGFSSTLRVAKFVRCQFPNTAAHQVQFPKAVCSDTLVRITGVSDPRGGGGE